MFLQLPSAARRCFARILLDACHNRKNARYSTHVQIELRSIIGPPVPVATTELEAKSGIDKNEFLKSVNPLKYNIHPLPAITLLGI